MQQTESMQAPDVSAGTSETNLTQEQALTWLRNNREFLNLKGIAKKIECAPSTLTVSVAGGKDSRGYDIPFPSRCLPAMQEIITQFAE